MKDTLRLAGTDDHTDVASVGYMHNGKLDEFIESLSAVSRNRSAEMSCITSFHSQWKLRLIKLRTPQSEAADDLRHVSSFGSVYNGNFHYYIYRHMI